MTDAATFQAQALADLDTQLAVWNSRMQVLDSQLINVQQTIQDSRAKLSQGYLGLGQVILEWLDFSGKNPDPSIDLDLMQQVITLRETLLQVSGVLTSEEEISLDDISRISESLGVISEKILETLATQSKTFSDKLTQASNELQTHFGITI